MILKLIDKNDPILRAIAPPFEFDGLWNPTQIAIDLTETMLSLNGQGLASNQVGLPHRAFVIKANPVIACFNPRIIDSSKEAIYLEEGCLSSPGLVVKIKRPKRIKVRYTRPDGDTVTEVYDGLTARIFQHELDHLNGIFFTSLANKYHLDQAKKRLHSNKK